MRVLAHIHTFNDADVIDGTIDAVLQQTHPVDGILVVDNASSDGTLDRPSLTKVTLLRHTENLGTSGAVYTGFRYALEQNYDWIWVFDADSVPEPNALEKLFELYASWPQNVQDEIGFLSCLPGNLQEGVPFQGGIFTAHGIARSVPVPGQRHYPCDFTFWSGCLYRLAAVRKVGLPNPDYVLDWGETEYGYRIRQGGYKGFMDQESVLQHNIRGYPTLAPTEIKRRGAKVMVSEFPPIRCYYTCRNILYFALYDFAEARLIPLCKIISRAFLFQWSFMIRPRNHGAQILAGLRGLWHGVTGNIAARY